MKQTWKPTVYGAMESYYRLNSPAPGRIGPESLAKQEGRGAVASARDTYCDSLCEQAFKARRGGMQLRAIVSHMWHEGAMLGREQMDAACRSFVLRQPGETAPYATLGVRDADVVRIAFRGYVDALADLIHKSPGLVERCEIDVA